MTRSSRLPSTSTTRRWKSCHRPGERPDITMVHASSSAGQQAEQGCTRFFCDVFSLHTRSAKRLAAQLGVHPSTLMSRFYRAGLPSPKTYLTYARLVWAAHLSESPALTIGDIADRLEASSPH